MYETENIIRKALNYPPYMDMLQIRILSYNEEKVKKVARKLKLTFDKMKEELLEKQREILENMNIDEDIRKRRIIEDNILKLKNMRIYDEVPFRIDKIMNQYYWKIIIKCNLNTYIAISASSSPKSSLPFLYASYASPTSPYNRQNSLFTSVVLNPLSTLF